jgi:translation initiation factor 2 subunit 1
MYSNPKPSESTMVYVTYRNYTDTGIEVVLPEYNDLEALLMYTEVSRKKYRSIGAICPLNGNDVLEVHSVTDDHIDLTKKHIRDTDRDQYSEFFKLSRRLHTILKKIAVKHEIPLHELYQDLAWPLYDPDTFPDYSDLEQHPINILRDIDLSELQVSDSLKTILQEERESLFGKRTYEVQQEIELVCHALDGFSLIRDTLSDIQKKSDPPVRIISTTVPRYQIGIKGDNREILTETINGVLAQIKTAFQDKAILKSLDQTVKVIV